MTDAAIPAAPSRSLLQRGPDIVVWGGVILLLLISFQPVEMGNAAKIAKAQAEFEKIQAAAAQKRAAEPDV